MRITTSIALLVLLTACHSRGHGFPDAFGDTGFGVQGGAPLESGFERSLTRSGGCGDLVLFAANADDTILVHFFASYALRDAIDAGGEPAVHDLSFPAHADQLMVQVGEHVSDDVCDDVLEFDVRVHGTWRPTAGGGLLTVTPGADGEPSTADLVLTDLLFGSADVADADDRGQTAVPSLTWERVTVGWWPG